jgi:hypothetical protein
LASFAVLFLYGQRLQGTAMLVGVGRQLRRLDGFRTSARKRLLTILGRAGVEAVKAEEKVDRLIHSFTISPVSLDPSGLVPKLEHVVNTYDAHLKAEVQTLVPRAGEAEVGTMTNLLEVSIGLDTMFRIVRHYYLLARKQGGMLALAQLQMALPTIMQEAEAYQAAVDAFAKGEPVGDGVGVLAASQLAGGAEAKEIVQDTVVSDIAWEGRHLLVVRAKGPGGNVGRPGLAVEQLIKEQGPVALVLTLDAALKLEGEVSGEVAEGVGAAIGGPGTERYRIEEAAVKHAIPLVAIVVKMSSKEAISTMTKPLRDAVEEVLRRVRRAVLAGTKPGDTTIVAGIGNTIGIA